MGIALNSNFDVNAALPLDSRDIVADITARNAIVSGRRYIGMMVYVLAPTNKFFYLKDGITNSDWKSIGGGGGGFAVVKTANYTVTIDDSVILGDATSGSLTFTLPTAADAFADQKVFIFKKIDSSVNTLEIFSLSLIDGVASRIIYDQNNDVVTLVSDGTTYYAI